MHLEAGHANPFQGYWHIEMLLKGTNRVLGAGHRQKLPIMSAVLRQLFKRIDFTLPLEVTFWAACLVAFFSFFQKYNVLVKSITSFDSNLHLCRRDAIFSEEGVSLAVQWSNTIRYRQRVLHIRLPRTPGFRLCPVQTLILALRLCSSPPSALLFTYPTRTGWLPLTVQVFQDKLHKYLGQLNINPYDYSGHSFRRGGHRFPWNADFHQKSSRHRGTGL